MKYRREIDGLRAVAILPVILFHAGFKTFEGGFVGVDVFFVVSGYLITTIILSDMNTHNFSIVTFYERRARRILPALFLVMICCLPFAWMWLLPNHLKDFSQSLTAVSLFSSNILFWKEAGYFGIVSELKPLLHTWSLAVEEQYYVLFPLLMILLWRFRKRWILGTLIVIGSASLIYAEWGAYNNPSATFFLLPTRIWEIGIGALIAFYLLYKEEHEKFIKSHNKACDFFGLIGLFFICSSIFMFDQNTPFPSFYALIPTLGTGLIIIFSNSGNFVGKFLGIKPLVGIGLISYSAYLWHQPLFAFARHRSLNEPGRSLIIVLSVASFLLAYITWRFVETPFRKSKFVSRKGVFLFAILGTLIFLSIGLVGNYTNGFESLFLKTLSSIDKENYFALRDGKEYVVSRFNNLVDVKFDDADDREKVLIIGDSYAQDLTNAVYEVGYDNYLQISTRHIPKECGNLFIPREKYRNEMSSKDLERCEDKGIYEDNLLRQKMLEADEIWLASSWLGWHTKYIVESVENLQKYAKKNIRVFGRKNFGHTNLVNFFQTKDAERYKIRNTVPKSQINVNEYMISVISPDVFVDVQRMLCGNEKKYCYVATDDGFIKAIDTTHLSPHGAEYYGKQLIRRGVFSFIPQSAYP